MAIIWCGALIASCEAAPVCAPPVEIANAPIDRVEPNGMLVTTDGRAVKLEGLLLPGGARDHAPQFLQEQALAALSDLTHSHLVDLDARPPKQDRYGRLRAQIFVTDNGAPLWIQTAMLSRGLARVSLTPDRPECAAELYAAEAQARAKHIGIWTLATYAVRDADTINISDLGTFQIVEGRVNNASVRSGRAYLNFGNDWRYDFTATIAPEDMKAFRDHDIDVASFYTGKTLRVRGIVESMNGPEIEIATPEQIEIVPDLRPRTTR
jgi:micrococcal nuclease